MKKTDYKTAYVKYKVKENRKKVPFVSTEPLKNIVLHCDKYVKSNFKKYISDAFI